MKMEKVKGFECPDCENFIPVIEEDLEIRFRCGECQEIYKDEEEAKDCCKE